MRPKYRMLIPRMCIAADSEAPSMSSAFGPKKVEPVSRAHELLKQDKNQLTTYILLRTP